MAIALVPGSFDPVTYGHLDIIRRTKGLFQEVRVLVARNSSKTSLFTTEERVEMLGQLCAEMDRVVVDSFDGLLVDYARQHGATAIVKGLRFVSDFEYELQMALANHRLNSELETVFLPTGLQYSDLSSSIVKEIARHSGAVEGLVPEIVQQRLRAKYANGNE